MTISVKHEPRKDVTIHELSFFKTPEDLVHSYTAGMTEEDSLILRWVHGVVFIFYAYPVTDTIAKGLVEGHLHWDHVAFAPMSNHNQIIKGVKKSIRVEVLDVSGNETFRAIGKFLQNKISEFSKQGKNKPQTK